MSSSKLNEITNFVAVTIERMLTTKEETLNIIEQYDMVLICAWEGEYLTIDIYQLSKFKLSKNKDFRVQNIAFFSAARSLRQGNEFIVYVDDHKETGLGIKNLQAFYYVCTLMDTVEVDVISEHTYSCVWS